MTSTPNQLDPLENTRMRQVIDDTISAYGDQNGALMVVLNRLQERIGFITKPMQAYVAEKLNVPVSKVHGVVSFYSFFTTEPRGKHIVKFCIGTACYVGGASQLIDKAKQVLGIEPGATTSDGLITLEVCRCVGACRQAPVVVVDEINHGRVKPSQFGKVLTDIQKSEAAA